MQRWRETATAARRQRYLDAAAALFAQRGYHGVSVEDLGAAAGVSGPALYRHFAGKGAVLAELLVDASERLLAGASAVVAAPGDARGHLEELVGFHVDFALAERAVIRVQERDLASLDEGSNRRVRSLQRRYVALWGQTVGALRPDLDDAQVWLRLHAVFGLLNSTPYSISAHDLPAARSVLSGMALGALLTDAAPGPVPPLTPGPPGAGAAAGRSGTAPPR